MTEQEIKILAIEKAKVQGFEITHENAGYTKLETETEIIEVGTTTNAKATVCIDRKIKDGLHTIRNGHVLINIGCKQATAEKKISQVI